MKTLLTFPFLLACSAPLAAEERRPPNPLVRVVTISQDGLQAKPGQPMVDAMIALLDKTASFKPDIVCLPEVFTRGEPEPVDGPTTTRLAAWAKEHSCYVINSIPVNVDGRTFNSAILIDRAGKIVGRYDKIRPTEGELEKKICPGPVDPPIFETDFGTIGMQICFDVNWCEQWQRLKEKGARIIFYPSAFPAARQIRALAWQNQCFIVSASRRSPSSLVDVTGDVIESTSKEQGWVGAVLPLGRQIFEVDFNTAKLKEIEKKYGAKVQVAWHRDDDLVSLASLDPELTVAQLIEEYKLTPHRAYMQRAQKAQDQLRPAGEKQP